MKFRILALFFFWTFSTYASPQLILHFDLNGTIIASDLASNLTLDEALNMHLAGYVTAKWDQRVESPVSYTDYVKTYLLPNGSRGAQRKLLQRFSQHLSETNHPAAEQVEAEIICLKSKLQNGQQLVFSSFYRVVEELNRRKIPYRIALRTFGFDLPKVIEEIEKNLGADFFVNYGEFSQDTLIIGSYRLDQPSDLYQFFGMAHAAVRDDWQWWQDHDTNGSFGKVFPIDSSDPETISIFFDDKIDGDPNAIHNIIHPIEVRLRKHTSVAELVKKGNAVSVDTLQAIRDDDYFIRHIDAMLESHQTGCPLTTLLGIIQG